MSFDPECNVGFAFAKCAYLPKGKKNMKAQKKNQNFFRIGCQVCTKKQMTCMFF